jgi:MFS family permease
MQTARQTYDRRFWLLAVASFFFFLSFNLILPELPDYLTSLGGADYKGWIIGLFALAAGISRPFSGKLVDLIGRKPIMVVGSIVCILLGLLYPLILGAFAFLTLRFFHGFSTGFNPTGSVAYLSDIIPANRRGEAMGVLGMMNNLGMSIGPALGSEIAKATNVNVMFWSSCIFALLSVLLIIKLPETLPAKEKMALKHLPVKKSEIFEKSVSYPAMIMTLTVFSFGAILTLIPDHAKAVGLEKQGYYFTVLTLTSVLVRIWSGRLSDRIGRRPVIIFGVMMLIAATLVLGFSNSVLTLFISAALFGLATGTNSPTLFAWAIDLSATGRVGRAMSTLFIALELGIVLGSVVPAAIYANVPTQMPWAFWSGTIMAFVALLILWRKKS